jgi:acyl dehydratase
MCENNKAFDRYFEDFAPGDLFRHAGSRTISDQDNRLFCELSQNPHPLHLDPEYAAQTEFGRMVVVGTYILALAVGLSVPDISYHAVANLSYETVTHHAPVFPGDTITAESEILHARPSTRRPDCGVVRLATRAWKQDGTLVLTFTRIILIPRRPAGV